MVSDNAYLHLAEHPRGAPSPELTHLDMYERGLNEMIGVGTTLGCKAFTEAEPMARVAVNAEALGMFSVREVTYLLACAVDRLSELALDGQTVYRCEGQGLETP
jgi:hypothetical protein